MEFIFALAMKFWQWSLLILIVIIGFCINLLDKNKKPNLIIANTIKGKGVKFMENKFESHYEVLDTSKYNISIKNLRLL